MSRRVSVFSVFSVFSVSPCPRVSVSPRHRVVILKLRLRTIARLETLRTFAAVEHIRP
jgi:hypothetical protein